VLGSVDLHDERTFRVHLAVIQPTPFCNINCSYCYLPDRSVTHRMSDLTCERTIRLLLSNRNRLAGHLAIAWHAGEPLTVPIDFYARAFELERELLPDGIQLDNWFQTNGTLLTQSWCDLIKSWDVRIGLSLDGPKAVHDAKRLDRAGRGTFDKVIRAVELLNDNRISFDTIAVLSESSLDYPDEIWRFYKGLGVRALSFSIEERKGVALTGLPQSQQALQRVARFFARLLELRDAEDPSIYIRELDYFLDGLPHWNSEFRSEENVPLCILGVSWDGNVTTFSPELIGLKDLRYGNFILGNVATESLEDILRNPKFRRLYSEIQTGVQRCKATCEYYSACGGGAPASKLGEHGAFDTTETRACVHRIKTIGSVVFQHLERQLAISLPEGASVRDRIANLAAALASAPPGSVSRSKRRRALE
jgi:uncharacterized protein